MLQTRRVHRLLLFILVRLLFWAKEGFQLLCTNYVVTRKVFSYQNCCPKVTNYLKIYRLAIRSRCATPLLDREVRIRLRLGCEQRLSQLLEGKILRWEHCILPRDIKNNPWHFDFQIRHGLIIMSRVFFAKIVTGIKRTSRALHIWHVFHGSRLFAFFRNTWEL